jgi:hypothetical protein
MHACTARDFLFVPASPPGAQRRASDKGYWHNRQGGSSQPKSSFPMYVDIHLGKELGAVMARLLEWQLTNAHLGVLPD